MQLLHDTNRNLYLVYTRWGQVGEDGMNQRTPFETLAKAKQEFHKIFKDKTANDFSKMPEYSRVEKKYNLCNVNEHDFNYKELLRNFDWTKVPDCKVERKVRRLIKSFAHPGYYRENMAELDLNPKLMPISSIKQESIDAAKKVLE
jgi:predicted DNA-binding WGR domain protein